MNKETELLLALSSSAAGETAAQVSDGVYPGTDLTVKFASDIGSDPWAWIRSRIQAGNYSGIHIGDYIPFTADGNTYQAQVAGIDTYRYYGATAIGRHIDFICRELWPTPHAYNKRNYNNGISTELSPWLASDLYHWLNSLSGNVPNGTGADPTTVAVDYSETGVYDKLPAALKAVIAEKYFFVENRYSAEGLLTDSPGNKWANIGKLWLPTEVEVYGSGQAGTAFTSTRGSVQYPVFRSGNRVKNANGGRRSWWLLNPASGNSTGACYVSQGEAGYGNATISSVYAPICFRIA